MQTSRPGVPPRPSEWVPTPSRTGAMAVALAAVAVMLALRGLLDPILGPQLPLATLYGAVGFAVWYGGAAAGILAAGVGYAGAHLLFIEPRGAFHLGPSHLVGAALYALSCGIIVGFGAALRRSVTRERAARLAHEEAENRAVAKEEFLAQRTQDLETLFASVPVPLWIGHDPECVKITGNPASYELLGVAPGANVSASGAPGAFPARHRRDGRELAPEELPMQRACREGRVVADQLELIRADGSIRVITAVAAPLRAGDGRVVGCVCAAQDVSDRVGMERALREADRRKDEFLAMLAHELRNPLAPIRNAVALLDARTGASQHDVAWACGVIDRQSRHMTRLLDDLLDLSRIARGKLALQLVPTDLREVLEAAIETSRPVLDAGGFALEVDWPAERIPLRADPVRLAQAVSNLLINAARYSQPGRRIWLVGRREQEAVVIAVRDEGRGIPPEALTRIFEMFQQEAGDGRALEGLGIGLALVKELVELHGGLVEARSEGTGKGSTFVVRLPAAADEERAPGPAPAERVAAARRVLVVDDSRDAADAVALVLRGLGHETRAAYDGHEAFESARTFAPDVAFVDVGMPGLDGLALARRIRAEPWGRSIFLVALSGWGQAEDRHRAAEAGFDRHLTKPAEAAALADVIAAAEPG